ncbi:BTB/POZ domain-containing protein 9-like protein, partial [Leptotrombidium deliense]
MAHTSTEEKFNEKLITRLRYSDKYSDVTFLVENESFKLHKCILAESCAYFDDILFRNRNEAKNSVIIVPSVKKQMFQTVIDFIYTGKLDTSGFSKDQIFELIAVSIKFKLDFITEALAAQIDLTGDFNELLTYCSLAIEHGIKEMKERCLKSIDLKAHELIDDNLFSQLPLNVLTEILKRDTFEVKELRLFFLVKNWISIHNEENVSGLLQNIRLNLIPAEQFVSEIRPFNLLTGDDYVNCLMKSFPPRLSQEPVNTIGKGVPKFAPEFQITRSESNTNIDLKLSKYHDGSYFIFEPDDEVMYSLEEKYLVESISFRIDSQT